MSSVQICSPRAKNISSISPSTMLERSSITLTNPNAIPATKTIISHIKTNRAVHLNTTPSPQQYNKFIFPITNNTHSESTNKPQKQNKPHKKYTYRTIKKAEKPIDMLSFRGYKRIKTIAPTLQGKVFIASKTSSHCDSLLVFGYIRQLCQDKEITNIFNICYNYFQATQIVVIKSACKKLYRHKMSVTDTGMTHMVKEDIVKEACLMKMFSRNKQPKSMIKYYDFFEDKNNFYLVMEQGGQGLFEFVVDCHRLISEGKLSLKEWKKTVRFIFAKMVQVINWMHNNMRCCNLDISLENVVMGKDTYVDQDTGKIMNLEIRFIDFGLTERFDKNNTDFRCNKYVGKTGYKAPKVFLMKQFCANKADIWSLAVCLFMCTIGAPLYRIPVLRDHGFRILKNEKVLAMLQNWSRLSYIGKNQYDLLMKMLNINEEERYCIEDVMKHQWIRSYFPNQKRRITRKFAITPIETDTMALHSNGVENESKSFPEKNVYSRTPSIKESETFEFKQDEYCAEVDNEKLNN